MMVEMMAGSSSAALPPRAASASSLALPSADVLGRFDVESISG
jgi:hypothetical protein